MSSISEKQKSVVNFANDPGGSFLLSCGVVRSGKTYANVIAFLLYTQSLDRPYEHLITGKNVDTITSAVIRPMIELAKGLKLSHHLRIHKSWLRIGRQIYHCRGAENNASAQAIQGLTCHSMLADEIVLFPREFWDMAVSRLSFPDSKAWCSCNPEGPLHPVKKLIDDGFFNEVLNFEFADNPALSAETIKRLESSFDGVFYRRKIKGEWAAAEGRIYQSYKVVKQRPKGKSKSVSLGVDVGNASTSAIIALQELDNERFHVADEKILEGSKRKTHTDDEIADAVVEMAEKHGAKIVYVDPAASSTREALRRHPKAKFEVRAGKNEVIPGIRHLGAALKAERCVINTRCEHLLDELASYEWAEGERPKKEHDHFCDALRYVSYSEIPRFGETIPKPLPINFYDRRTTRRRRKGGSRRRRNAA